MLFADHVKDLTTTAGTGNVTLAGTPPVGFFSFGSSFATGSGNKFKYGIINGDGSEVEVGEGYLSDSTTLVRETVERSTNADALVSFSAGTKTVIASVSAASFNEIWAAIAGKVDGTLGVKVYRALLTQSGTSAPTATVLENSLGGTVVWTYSAVGAYIGTLASAFPADKTFLMIGFVDTQDGEGVAKLQRASDNTVYIKSLDMFGTGNYNDQLINTPVEILVYP